MLCTDPPNHTTALSIPMEMPSLDFDGFQFGTTQEADLDALSTLSALLGDATSVVDEHNLLQAPIAPTAPTCDDPPPIPTHPSPLLSTVNLLSTIPVTTSVQWSIDGDTTGLSNTNQHSEESDDDDNHARIPGVIDGYAVDTGAPELVTPTLERTPVLDLFDLGVLHPFNIPLCTLCCVGIDLPDITGHISKHRRGGPKRRDDEITALFQEVGRLRLVSADDVTIPAAAIRRTHLLPSQIGFACAINDCRRCGRSIRTIERHQTDDHAQNSPRARVIRRCVVSWLYKNRKKAPGRNCFEVCIPADAATATAYDATIFRAITTAIKEAKASAPPVIHPAQSFRDHSLLNSRLHWSDLMVDCDPSRLVALAALPNTETDTFRPLVDECFSYLKNINDIIIPSLSTLVLRLILTDKPSAE